jgi:hypothetical protein
MFASSEGRHNRKSAHPRSLPHATDAPPPALRPPHQSENVKAIAHLPEMATAISINFIGDAMFVSTVTGVYAYDVANPAAPKLLSALPMYIWENEDVDVDPVRKRLYVSRDPRGFTSPVVPGSVFPWGMVQIIDVSNPSAIHQLNAFLVQAGHTTTCINNCDFVWTTGPVASITTQPSSWGGRPIFATDVRDPINPTACPHPIDTSRNDGKTDYAHDVQVDAAGVAWVSGRGGVRGYWTDGWHRNPFDGRVELATGCDPIPYAGSGTPTSATPSRFMHNAWRDYRAGQPSRNDVLLATEEEVVSDCKTAGRFVTYDLRGTYDGEGFKDTARTRHRMTVLDTWTPERQPGSDGCASSHYFTSRGDGITANAFYDQGVRFLDTSDPTNIRQVGFYREDDSNTWAAYWHGKDTVFVADFQRGVEVLRFVGGARATRTVRAPAARVVPKLRFSRTVFGGLCPLTIPPA